MTRIPKIGFLLAANEVDVQWFKPLAFGYLKAYLDTHLELPIGMEFLARPEECVGFDVIAISSTSQAFAMAKEMAGSIRRDCREAIIILGGHHITYFPESLSEDFDLGVIGEGEETFLEIVRYLIDSGLKITSEHLRSINGIVFRDNGLIVKTSRRNLISPLDSIPFPHRTRESAYLFSSRGCPYKCAFCSSSAFWEETRFFSADYVVREVEHLLEHFPDLTDIALWDDLFVVNRSRFHSFVRLIEKKKINKRVAFSFSVRANLVDDALCDELKRINVSATSFGAESGSNKVLKVLNKGTSVEMNQRALDILHKNKIAARCSFILGSPTETEEDLRSTYEFILRNVLDGKLAPTSPVNILIPMPGTDIWNYAIRSGIIDEKNIDWSRLSAYASYRNSTFTDFPSWMAYRRAQNTVYLAEDTLPQERLYELMFTYEGVLKSLEISGSLKDAEKPLQAGANESVHRSESPEKMSRQDRRTLARGEHVSNVRSPEKRAICILGMHRSGTSAIARAINLLGPYIGPPEHLMKPVQGDNPRGFWEHTSFYSLHEEVLSFLSSSWDSLLPLPEEWWKKPDMDPYREELSRIIKADFNDHSFWMWKDPRTALLLPLWKDVTQKLGIEVQYVICSRNPLDVAASLLKRNGFPKTKSLSLWLLYTLSSLYWTTGEKRAVIHFEDLMLDWQNSLAKIAASLDIPWPTDDRALQESMTCFLRPEDRHSRSDSKLFFEDMAVPEPAKELYRLILDATKDDSVMTSEWFSGEIAALAGNYRAYSKIFSCEQTSSVGRGDDSAKLILEAPPEGLEAFRIKKRAEAFLAEEASEMVFPASPSCQASIIIPVWNHWEYTYACLRSILANSAELAYEVIIIDNGSSDRTEELLSRVRNIMVVRNQSNLGYVLACNQGAALAQGQYLVFLNNDTEPLAGWVKELVSAAVTDEAVGAVGGKLIYPDGLLQEAGGIIFRDGHSLNFGNGEDPNEEIYNIRCEVDYCSGACLLVKKDLFADLGGFDISYSPAYYEDVDMCFSLRKKGFKTIYNPDTRVVHHGSVTSGANKSEAWNHQITANRKIFCAKWETDLVHQDPSASSSGKSPVTASRERLGSKELSSEEALLILHAKKSSQGRYPATLLTEKSIHYMPLVKKEEQSLSIITRAAGLYGNDRIGIEWTGDMDSTAVLHMVRRTFGGNIPFIVIDAATNHESPERRRFIEQLRSEWEFSLHTYEHIPIYAAARESAIKAVLRAQRWNEQQLFPPCQFLSPEENDQCVTVRPIIHFTELDLLHYTKKHHVPFCRAFFPPSDAPLPEFKASIMVEDAPSGICVNSIFRLRVRIKNTGTSSWPSRGRRGGKYAVALSYHWIDKNGNIIEFDGRRTPLFHDVGPGQEAVLYAGVLSPLLPGDYTLELDLLQEGITWFKDQGSETLKITITVADKLPRLETSSDNGTLKAD